MSQCIRLALADDQALVRLGLKALLSSFERLEIVIEAQNGQQLLDELETCPVDVILSDIRMPGRDGFQILAPHCHTVFSYRDFLLQYFF